MSGLAVVLSRDGSPADEAAVRRVLVRLAHRGPDGEHVAASGAAAIGHRHFWTTPEEVGERQPLADPAGRLLIAADGRVDNRDDLTRALGIAGAEAAASDARLLLLVYERWGIPGFARVVGSFAAAVWDAAERRLVLVRDPLGDRPLCYASTPAALVAASEEHAVLAHPGVSDALDERRLVQFLSVTVAELDSDATFFAAVKEVLPGHALVVDEAGAKAVRYWEASPQRALCLRDDREYGEAFREALGAAVQARLRSTSPVALMLSGGLDSSGIAGLAAVLAPPPALLAVSWTFDELPSCDERAFIDPVVEHCRLAALQFCGDDEWPFREFTAVRHNPSSPEDDLYRRLVQRGRAMARAAGARVVLSGMFGDHLYSGADAWTWRRPGAGSAGALAAAWAEARRPQGLRRLLAAGVALLPPGVTRVLRRLRGADAPWLTSHARHVLGGSSGLATPVGALRPSQHYNVAGMFTAHSAAVETFQAACDGVEVRYPYRDRRLVELALSLPDDQLYRPGVTRPVARQALLGLVPEVVRKRSGKTALVDLYRRGVVERERHTILAALAHGRPVWRRLVRERWVDRAAPGTRRAGNDEIVLIQCAALARWLDKRGGGVL